MRSICIGIWSYTLQQLNLEGGLCRRSAEERGEEGIRGDRRGLEGMGEDCSQVKDLNFG
jgi:hypothetical protein